MTASRRDTRRERRIQALQQTDTKREEGLLLDVQDLRTWFRTPRGIVRAVDGVTFDLQRGKTIGIVGESGSGKTVLSRSVMGLLPKSSTFHPTGKVMFDGKDLLTLPEKQMRDIWGEEVAMVMQDPMTSLNPVVKIGRQITEGLEHHLGMKGKDAKEAAVALLTSVGIPEPDAAPQPVPARALRRHAPAGDDRHRARLRPPPADRRRAHHRARRDRAGPDPRPPAEAAARALHGHGPRHPRPRGRGRPYRRDHRDVRRADRGEGARPTTSSTT